MRRSWGVVTAVAVAVALTGCTTRNIDFRVDDRLDIVSPGDGASVPLPIALRWTIEDFTVTGPDGQSTGDAGFFAVFLDRAVITPGKTLESLVGDDDACRRAPDCPDEAYLRERNVFITTNTELVFDALPDRRPRSRPGAKDRHEATIILIDGEGRRIGESAFSVSFVVDREPR